MAMTYNEKATLVMKLNKRMRDIINKTGFNTAEFTYWENKIDNMPTTTAYTSSDQEYHLLSRSRSDIESYSDDDLKRLEQSTRTWSEIKRNVVQSMKEQQKAEIQNIPDLDESAYLYRGMQPTMQEINDFLKMRKTINEWFEENSDLVYALLESTGWEDIQQHSTREIMETVKKLRESDKYGTKQYGEEDRDKLRAQYRARRKKAEARIALARG